MSQPLLVFGGRRWIHFGMSNCPHLSKALASAYGPLQVILFPVLWSVQSCVTFMLSGSRFKLLGLNFGPVLWMFHTHLVKEKNMWLKMIKGSRSKRGCGYHCSWHSCFGTHGGWDWQWTWTMKLRQHFKNTHWVMWRWNPVMIFTSCHMSHRC